VSKNLLIGFILLPIGVLITPLAPEFGLPIILFSTRFLKEKYSWAERINSWAEAKLRSARNWFRKRRNY
jgi:hypothetical protein